MISDLDMIKMINRLTDLTYLLLTKHARRYLFELPHYILILHNLSNVGPLLTLIDNNHNSIAHLFDTMSWFFFVSEFL